MIYSLRILSIFFLFCFLVAIPSRYSYAANYAACLPGIPCLDPYTPNTPSDPSDGPNVPPSRNAPKSEHNACDADFMNQIYARATLEANRNIMIGGLMITKPDSVLEYTCFDQVVRDTAQYAAPIFTESEEWSSGAYNTITNPGTSDITINTYMGQYFNDISLNRLVMTSLNEYKDSNFAHDFLGGTAVGVNNSIATDVASAQTTCTFMNDIFFLAKCENINPAVHFMKFSEMAVTDPRDTLPAALQCGGPNPITVELIRVAENENGVHAYTEDVSGYLGFTDPTSCATPIPTGLQVEQQFFCVDPTTGKPQTPPQETRIFDDYVCANAGCFYHHNTTSCRPDYPAPSAVVCP